MTDPSGLWGEIERHGGDRAVVCSNDVNDSWTSLAVKSGFSSSDWPKWVATLDNGPLPTKPELNKKYTIPNVIYFARGHDFNNDPAKQRAIYDTWQASMDPYEFIYQALGFKVTENDDILKFIQDPNIYGFMFVGHGTGDNEKPFFGSIVLNTPNPALAKNGQHHPLGGVRSWVLWPGDASPHHRLALVHLAGCHTWEGAWETWVSENGTFVGYDFETEDSYIEIWFSKAMKGNSTPRPGAPVNKPPGKTYVN
jgi:hypothetical protein